MINAAIVGLGRWGQVLVSSVQGKSDKIRFTAGVTRTVSKAADYAREKGFPLGDDYEAVLRDKSIQAIVLATPHSQHAEQIKAAAKAKKHVFVEKPFTLDKKSAEAAVKAMDRAKRVLALGHNRRFLPAWSKMKGMVDDGSVGTVTHVEANYSGNGAFRFPKDGWRADRDESPAGGMGGTGIHMVDTFIGMFGRIKSVYCISKHLVAPLPIDDTTVMLFEFESGMTGYLASNAATVQTWRIEAFGTKATVEIDDHRKFVVRPQEGQTEITDMGAFDMERAEMESFADACEGRGTYPLPTDQAIHGVAVFEAIMKSAASGKTVAVK